MKRAAQDDSDSPIHSVHVTKTEGPNVEVTLRVRFDPSAIGTEKANMVWDGIGAMLAAILEPDERVQFLEKLRAALDPKPEAPHG